MLSLANRIMSQTVIFPGSSQVGKIDVGMVAQKVNASKMLLRNCPKIRLDNVASYYYDHPKAEWCIQDDIPNWSPPFSHFWCEWEEIPFLHTDRNNPDVIGFRGQVGCSVLSMNVTDESKSDPSLWLHLMGGLVGLHHKYFSKEQVDQVCRAINDSKWCLFVSCFSSTNIGQIAGKPIYLGDVLFMFVSPDGRCRYSLLFNPFTGTVSCWSIYHILGLGISFMHCKNVKQVEAKEDPGERFRTQYKVPKFTYRTLCIDPMKEVLRREGQSETTGLKRALHICRGHFSTYSDEKPLFGKYAGTFWVPDHVRGKKEHGEVVKDYEVKPANTPASEHA